MSRDPKNLSKSSKSSKPETFEIGKEIFVSVLLLNNIWDIFKTTGDTTNERTLVFSGLANRNKITIDSQNDLTAVGSKSQESKNIQDDLVGNLLSELLEKLQNSFRESRRNGKFPYILIPNPDEIKWYTIKKFQRLTLVRFVLINSMEDSSISPESLMGILIPSKTVLANLVLDPSGKICLELIAEQVLLRKRFFGSRVLTEIQLNLASEFLKILNSMVMDSNKVVLLNVSALKFKPDDLLSLLQILEKLQLKYIHLMPLDKDYQPEIMKQINLLINKINNEMSKTATVFSSRAKGWQKIPEPSSISPNANTTGPKDKR